MAFIAENYAGYFCLKNNLGESDFGDVLDAVEHHDDKEYKKLGIC